MCGIAGIFDLREMRTPAEADLRRMASALRHRGPDDEGFHVEPGLGFAHRRLSIIDLSGGHQPLGNEDGTVLVAYNGEIYNFPDLIVELESLGHSFRTRCDTEVLVHGWEEWGDRCVDRFRGMFAFAIWDRSARTLFLARDRFGVKPLYYALLSDGLFMFGSELKALISHPSLPLDLNPRAIEDYFALGYVPDPRSILSSVQKLPPGHCLTLKTGGTPPTPRAYWEIPLGRSSSVNSPDEVIESLVERLRESVRLRMISDVPLGAFLSGGVDSGAVVALMAELASERVTTCTISFEDQAYDEARYAEVVARRYRTDHHVSVVQPDGLESIEGLAEIFDEPFADSSAIPTAQVCRVTRNHVKVALSGDGGDETFAGYQRYPWHVWEERVRASVPGMLRRALFGGLARVYPKADWAPRVFRARTTLEELSRDPVDAFHQGVSIIRPPERERLLTKSFRAQLEGYRTIDLFRQHAQRVRDAHPLIAAQYLDFKTYLPGDILTKVDRASMASSLEVREPLLDQELVAWAFGLPPSLKLRFGVRKYLLKAAFRPHLGDALVTRRKMGFRVPLSDWFRGPMRESLRARILDPWLDDLGIVDREFVGELLDRHLAGVGDHGAALWTVLMFGVSLRRILEPSPIESAR